MPTYPYLKIDHVDKSFNRGSATTEVLKDGAMPLSILEKRIEDRARALAQA